MENSTAQPLVARPWYRLGASVCTLLLAAVLLGCGGGGGGDDSATADNPPTDQPPTDQPPADPPPTDQPPPEEPRALPPLAAAVDLGQGGTPGETDFGKRLWPDGNSPSGGQGQTVEGLECREVMFDEYHVHAHLNVYLDGERQAIPASIGIVRMSDGTQCFYPLHTHNLSGVLHVEATAPTRFTLGQQFAIWGEPLGFDNFAGLGGRPVRIFIKDPGADLVEFTGDPKEIELTNHREITVQVGTAIDAVPTYNWTF